MLRYLKIFLCIILMLMSSALASISELESNNSTAVQTTLKKNDKIIPKTNIAIEGGTISASTRIVSSTTPPAMINGRERVTEKADKVTNSTSINTAKISSSTTEKIIPVSEKVISISEEEHKKTVPRKGVQFNDILLEANKTTINDVNKSTINDVNKSTTTDVNKPTINDVNKSTINDINKTVTVKINTNKTLTTIKPKKPLITKGSDDEPYAPSHFVSSKSKNISIPKVPQLESEVYLTQKDGSEYIAPIIGVILSVPLVAIIVNLIYKRSKEWWHHRHYRRMDFLIDGMYNHS